MPVTDEQARELYERYAAGEASRVALAESIGVSHETLRQAWNRLSLPLGIQLTRAREDMEREAYRCTEQIWAAYKRLGTVEGVAKEFPFPRRLLSKILADMPDREGYRRRGQREVVEEDKLLTDLTDAAQRLGEPLSAPRYMEEAPKYGWAAYNTHVRHFGTWYDACQAAGVKANPPTGRRGTQLEAAVEAVSACFRAHGGRVSYAAYDRWARDTPYPCGGSIRTVGRWNDIAAIALEQLGEAA